MKKLSAAAVLGLACLSGPALAKVTSEVPFVPGEVLVKLRPGFKGAFLQKNRSLIKKELSLLSGEFFLLIF